MLQKRSSFDGMADGGEVPTESPREFIDVDQIISAARRQWLVVAVSMSIAGVLGYLYLAVATPVYTASARVLIDQGNSQIVDQLSVVGGVVEDEANVLSQVELIKSERIGLAVVDKLDLLNDSTFNTQSWSLLGAIKGFVSGIGNMLSFAVPEEQTAEEIDAARASAAARLLGNVDVVRIGRSYVLEIYYTSSNAPQAAAIVGAIADAYLTDQLDSKYEAITRASTWLQQRIEELRQKSLESDLAVQRFRAENDLIATTSGQLVSDQNLQELNSQLISAKAEVSSAEAKYQRIKTIIDNKQTDAIVSDALGSSVITSLRTRYLDASKLQTEIIQRLGPDHVSAKRLSAEMAEYERLIFDELGRIAQSYLSELAVAKARLETLQESVNAATGVTSSANTTLVQLRELERESETYKNLYQTFLQRYQETIQQRSFPIAEARIISSPRIPGSPSAPKSMQTLLLALAIGGVVGAGIGAFREFRDRFFRTAEQVRAELNQEFLGFAPIVQANADQAEATARVHRDRSPTSRTVVMASPVDRFVIDHPLSSFAETLRAAKVAADLNFGPRRPKTIGVVSVLPGEGKTTVAINFAELLASQGARTLLIDADLRNPGTTRAIARNSQVGLVEAITEGRPIRDLLLMDPETRLAVLPAVVKRRISHAADHLASNAMLDVLKQTENVFDYVILDLPPLAPVVDVRAIASRIDGFIFVVEWGRTARQLVRSTLINEPQVAEKCLGVVLNKVDMDRLKLYRAYGSSEYYYGRFSSYYRDERAS